jgi:ferritin
MGSLILWGFITFIFFQWFYREQHESESPPWREIEDELEAMGLTGGTQC